MSTRLTYEELVVACAQALANQGKYSTGDADDAKIVLNVVYHAILRGDSNYYDRGQDEAERILEMLTPQEFR